MLIGSHEFPFLAGFASIVIGLTVMAAVGLDGLNPRRPRLTIVISALIVPVFLAVAAAILGSSSSHSPDAAGMAVVALLFLTLAAFPISLVVSGAVVWARRSLKSGRRALVR